MTGNIGSHVLFDYVAGTATNSVSGILNASKNIEVKGWLLSLDALIVEANRRATHAVVQSTISRFGRDYQYITLYPAGRTYLHGGTQPVNLTHNIPVTFECIREDTAQLAAP